MPATSVLLALAQSDEEKDRADARSRILAAMRKAGGNITRAAPLVSPPVSRVTLHRAITALAMNAEIERTFAAEREQAMIDRALAMTEGRTHRGSTVSRAPWIPCPPTSRPPTSRAPPAKPR